MIYSTTYYLLKITHIIIASLCSASLLLTLLFPSYAKQHHTLFTAIVLTTLILEPISGFSIMTLQHYHAQSGWLISALVGFLFFGGLWLILWYQQQKNPNARTTHSILITLILIVIALLYQAMIHAA